MSDRDFRIRAMQVDDLAAGLRLSTGAGWNQTERDWRRLHGLTGAGSFVAEAEGEVIGTTLVVSFGEVAWIAMVLVEERFRGRGVGRSLVAHALAFCDAAGVATVRLDATPLGEPVYARLGFRADYELVRYAGVASGGSGRTEPLEDADFEEILRLDRDVTGYDRGGFLRQLRAERPDAFLGHRAARGLGGFLHVRQGRLAEQVGPCLALDEGAGVALLNRAVSIGPPRRVILDVPCPHMPSIAWARAAGLAEQRRLLRMYRGRPPGGRTECIWAGSGPEKG